MTRSWLLCVLLLLACNLSAQVSVLPTVTPSLAPPPATLLPSTPAPQTSGVQTPGAPTLQTFSDLRRIVALDYPAGWYTHGDDYDYILTSFAVAWMVVQGVLTPPPGEISISLSLMPLNGTWTVSDLHAYLHRGLASPAPYRAVTLTDGTAAGITDSASLTTLFAVIGGYGVILYGTGDPARVEPLLLTLGKAGT